ncbi:MAG TPA: hypothetical protein VN325_23420 [Steroidobacteraceae bacterium]|nr:hypothetical protein [Steroidobacteraceae bacterium]
MPMKYFWGTVGFWTAVLAVSWMLKPLEHSMNVGAAPITIQESKGDSDGMSFAKHLELNPEMFQGAMPEDQPDIGKQRDLKGGVLGDPTTVHTLLFLKAGDGGRSGRPAD